ncbi:ABC transporter G family protein [Tieghemostelium lacteum]|uniref:ABC transporter G family protein n=1 Tax=Tieghemostelium lacteum TaxID=361077 RepID=A0A151ZBU4_TIELA|nr:ABC transporter G family protein [Tieghemostelium lacteum]|eukprot:KYQ91364.1 ABC transporter G family protein [Tieghemostelium lacteum]
MTDTTIEMISTESSSTSITHHPTIVKSKSQLTLRRNVTISFQNLCYSVDVKKKEPMQILKNISGTVNPGELVSVMGPSGSGKTTLLDILANRKEAGHITGTLLINGQEIDDDYKRLCSYIVQEDVLLPTMTVRETLRFYADLKLPSSWTNREKNERIDSVLDQIGLTHRADAKIGGMLPGGLHIRGLSGGEKRRTTLGCGLITSPSIILLDEPTSGLDSTAAMQVMKTLVTLTQEKNVTVICSIHQPRSEIFRLFTKSLVLADGRLVYYGSEAVQHFSALGYPFPDQTNPADYILDVVTQIRDTGKAHEISDKLSQEYQNQSLNEATQNGGDDQTALFQVKKKKISAFNNNMWVQFGVLMRRTGWDFVRNPANSLVRFAVAVLVGLLFGACFANLPMTATGVQARAGVLFYLAVNMVLQPFCSISLFISKRTLFNAERAARLYHSLPYYLAMMFYEIIACIVTAFTIGTIAYWFADLNPGADNYFFCMCILTLAHLAGDFFILFLSCLTVQIDTTFAVGAGITTIYQLWSSFFVHVDKLPQSFQWLHYINFLFYSFRALMANEFEGTTMDCGLPEGCPTGVDILNSFGMEDTRKGIDLIIVSSFALGFFIMVYLCLHYLHREKR